MDEEQRQMNNNNKMKVKNEMTLKNNNEQQQQQKPPCGFSQAKYHLWEFLTFDLKKMIPDVLLVLPLYLILFFIWRQFQPLIKVIIGDIFGDDFFRDIVDTPKEGIEQHKKRQCLKSVIDKGKGYLSGK